jgi:hypothetical protein
MQKCQQDQQKPTASARAAAELVELIVADHGLDGHANTNYSLGLRRALGSQARDN